MSIVPLHRSAPRVVNPPRVVSRRLKYIDQKLIDLLRRHKDQVVSIERLITAAWGDRPTGGRDNLRQRMSSHIRPYLAEYHPNEEIITVAREGYMMVDTGRPIDSAKLEKVDE